MPSVPLHRVVRVTLTSREVGALLHGAYSHGPLRAGTIEQDGATGTAPQLGAHARTRGAVAPLVVLTDNERSVLIDGHHRAFAAYRTNQDVPAHLIVCGHERDTPCLARHDGQNPPDAPLAAGWAWLAERGPR